MLIKSPPIRLQGLLTGLDDLCHAVGRTITFDQCLERYPLHLHAMFGKGTLQRFRLARHCHDVARCNGEKVVGIVQLILKFDGDDGETSLPQELNEGYLTL